MRLFVCFLTLASICSCQRDGNVALIRERISTCCDKKIDKSDISVEKKNDYYIGQASNDDQTQGFYFLGHVLNGSINLAMVDNRKQWLTNDSINKLIVEADKKLFGFSLHVNDIYIDSDKISIRLVTNKMNALFGNAYIRYPEQFKNLNDYRVGNLKLMDSIKNTKLN